MKVFIVGCGRSGTSLLRTMLNHHKDLFIPTESLFMIDYLKTEKNLSPQKAVDLILKEPQLKLWLKHPEKFKNTKFSRLSELFDQMHQSEMLANKKKYWGQKTPRFIRYSQLLKSNFPDIKFLILVRDPRAVVNSFRNSKSHNSFLPHIVRRWKKDIYNGKKIIESFPEDSMELKYEDLILNPQNTLKEVCSFLNLDYDENMLNYTNKKNEEYSKMAQSTFKQLKNKPNKNRIASWKEALTETEISKIESETKPLLTEFGYPIISKISCENMKYSKLLDYIFWIPVLFRYLKMWPQELFHVIKRKFILSIFAKSLSPFIN